MDTKRMIQIGVMGSAADLGYSAQIEALAEEVGYQVAQMDAALIFGAEKDGDSLSTAACRGAKRGGGLTVGITYGKGKAIYQQSDVDIVIATGLERGGGRELTLALSCDVLIALGGGSGTLTEIAIAYQANIPVVVIANTGGWSEKLADTFLDDRNRYKIISTASPSKAVEQALKLAKGQR